MCNHKNILAFTLIEVLAALAILALSTSTVLLVINQNVLSAADSVHRMEAFRLARENMERILASDSVTETVEFGTSDRYPDISWRTVVEAFSEPTEGKMWLRAVCTAGYTGSTGQSQTLELVHWLTPLTEQQAEHFLENDEGSLLADQLISNAEGAARYAQVDTTTIEQWISDGLVVTADGAFIKHNLDIFIRSKGHPSDAARAQQVHSLDELASAIKNAGEGQSDMSQADRPAPAADGSPTRPPLRNQGLPDVGPGERHR